MLAPLSSLRLDEAAGAELTGASRPARGQTARG
jgi:hypothetical protein